MFRIDEYIENLTEKLKAVFGERLIYVGLQGSYLRGEANENSDIDIMAVIDSLSAEDLNTYRETLISVGDFDKSCGFICSKTDLKHWNPLEVCHLLHTTKDLFGKLKELVPPYTEEDERNYIKLSINNFYHEICRRYIHSDTEYNISKLPMTCKSVFYIMQHLYYIKSGRFIQTKQRLLENLNDEDRNILQLSISVQNNSYDLDSVFPMLFNWCQRALTEI